MVIFLLVNSCFESWESWGVLDIWNKVWGTCQIWPLFKLLKKLE